MRTFSRRADWTAQVNRLTKARAARDADLYDLTQANPTRANIDYPLDELAKTMTRAARVAYDPHPRGLLSARETLGDPEDLILTASTSEAYSFLFKLLCDPGDNVVSATPSYPLFEHLAALESVELRHFPLEFHGRWELHAARVREVVDEKTRAIIVVNPNNPTGSYVTPAEQRELASIGLPVISDEVFLDYGNGASFTTDEVLTFRLGGLSKSVGLPHFKLAWMRVAGPGKEQALEALELIADNYLSVATPVQAALPDLLRIGKRIHAAIAERVSSNLAHLQRAITPASGSTLLPVEGGWSAVIRVPRIRSDEELALELIEQYGVVVHPGYFFDFEEEGHLVVSLLTPSTIFEEGIERLLDTLSPER